MFYLTRINFGVDNISRFREILGPFAKINPREYFRKCPFRKLNSHRMHTKCLSRMHKFEIADSKSS